MRKKFWTAVAQRLRWTVPTAVASVFLAQVIVGGWYEVNWATALHTGVWAAVLTVAGTLITFEPEQETREPEIDQPVFDQERN